MSIETAGDWLDKLEPGDKIYVDSGHTGYQKVTVARLTKTQIIVKAGSSESRYSRKDGRKIGASGYFVGYLRRPSEQIEKYFLAEACSVRFDTQALRRRVSVEALQQLKAAIDRVKEEAESK